jgi:uncharacterized protein
MRLALESDPNIHLIRSYEGGVISIGAQQITRPCAVSPRSLILEWPATSVGALTEVQLDLLLDTGANIVLLGANGTPQLPGAAIRARCRAKGIALETMNLGAACRTYNILASEDRAVVAGLFP